MAKFVVAKINFYDNDLTQVVKDYPSLGMAYVYEAQYIDCVLDEEDDGQDISIEDIKQRYFDTDMMINIIEV